uniref:Uncharacterized protein n=1 Tax=Anopheles atroparvus TaxID=41427 RepID=A0A182JLP4_ANOAO
MYHNTRRIKWQKWAIQKKKKKNTGKTQELSAKLLEQRACLGTCFLLRVPRSPQLADGVGGILRDQLQLLKVLAGQVGQSGPPVADVLFGRVDIGERHWHFRHGEKIRKIRKLKFRQVAQARRKAGANRFQRGRIKQNQQEQQESTLALPCALLLGVPCRRLQQKGIQEQDGRNQQPSTSSAESYGSFREENPMLLVDVYRWRINASCIGLRSIIVCTRSACWFRLGRDMFGIATRPGATSRRCGESSDSSGVRITFAEDVLKAVGAFLGVLVRITPTLSLPPPVEALVVMLVVRLLAATATTSCSCPVPPLVGFVGELVPFFGDAAMPRRRGGYGRFRQLPGLWLFLLLLLLLVLVGRQQLHVGNVGHNGGRSLANAIRRNVIRRVVGSDDARLAHGRRPCLTGRRWLLCGRLFYALLDHFDGGRLADLPASRAAVSRPGASFLAMPESSFLISAIALPGFRPFGHVRVQFMIVWHRYTLNGSFSLSSRAAVLSSRESMIHRLSASILLMQASVLMPPMFMAQEPQMPSRQDRRNSVGVVRNAQISLDDHVDAKDLEVYLADTDDNYLTCSTYLTERSAAGQQKLEIRNEHGHGLGRGFSQQ